MVKRVSDFLSLCCRSTATPSDVIPSREFGWKSEEEEEEVKVEFKRNRDREDTSGFNISQCLSWGGGV